MSDSPKSARTAFKPISKMTSRSILRDRNPPNPQPETELHVVTPARNKIQSFFGKVDRASSRTPPPAVPPVPAQHRIQGTPGAVEGKRRGYDVGTMIQEDIPPPPVPKIRAGMTPEARTRLMPTPKPLPPSKLRSQTSSTPGTTMRLVPRKSVSQSIAVDSFDLPLRTQEAKEALADVGWQELGSQSSHETVLVTVR